MKKQLVTVFFFSILFSSAIANGVDNYSETPFAKPTIFNYLSAQKDIPKYILTTDLKDILKNKNLGHEIPSTLEIITADHQESWNIDVSIRGKSRRRICSLPPLKLKFKKKELKDRDIRRKYNDLKLVTYCKRPGKYENFVLKEYIVYQMYRNLTDYSFKVKLIEIEYRDVNNKVKPIIRYGFIIENADEMANRLNAKVVDDAYNYPRDSMDHYQYDTYTLFQYMIGNSDWKIKILHNTKVIRDKDTKIYYPIPYDFDYSGFVNASYAIPNPNIRQNEVTERVYLGESKSPDDFKEIVAHFNDKKEEVLKCGDSFPMTRKQRKRMFKFMKRSFRCISSEKRLRKRCLNRRQLRI